MDLFGFLWRAHQHGVFIFGMLGKDGVEGVAADVAGCAGAESQLLVGYIWGEIGWSGT